MMNTGDFEARLAQAEQSGSLAAVLELMGEANDIASVTIAMLDQDEAQIRDALRECADDPEKVAKLKPLLAELQQLRRGLTGEGVEQ